MHRLKALLIITTISFLLINCAFSQNAPVTGYPTYRDGILTIPRVDTDAQVGNFQDAIFQFDNITNTWRLLDYMETTIAPGRGLVPDTVELIVTSTLPIQVFLKINGFTAPSPCSEFGQINQRLKTNKFEVTMHVVPGPNDITCATIVVPYEKIIPLAVYGLPAGTYEYSLNGEHTGTFSLAVENTL
ncbi:MAG: hypothetical protein DYH15_05990 [Nitrosomonas sp. PRO4]|nr:hypothetical protein [Nitrosomonas sp. PRO4]